jgi:hypothetical protein
VAVGVGDQPLKQGQLLPQPLEPAADAVTGGDEVLRVVVVYLVGDRLDRRRRLKVQFDPLIKSWAKFGWVKRLACEFKVPVNVEELAEAHKSDRVRCHSVQRRQLYFTPFLPQSCLKSHKRPHPETGNVLHEPTVDNDFRPPLIQMVLDCLVELIGRRGIETSMKQDGENLAIEQLRFNRQSGVHS